ncbi:MAG: hypothetical protein IPP71_14650 [Bacteroidetes bacterium]|nr:hypothetical protein [Bacteroidota bacterium]
MKKIIVLILALFPLIPLSAQVATTEIFLIDIVKKDKKLTYGIPINITNRDGYDNQPEFTPDGSKILYVVMPDSTQADLFEYTIADSTTKQLSETAESEYSQSILLMEK